MNAGITVRSYLLQRNELVSLCDYEGDLEDPDYIEGAIELTIAGKKLIGGTGGTEEEQKTPKEEQKGTEDTHELEGP